MRSVIVARKKKVAQKTIKPFKGNKLLSKIKTYGDLLAAEHSMPPRLAAAVRKKIQSIHKVRAKKNTQYTKQTEKNAIPSALPQIRSHVISFMKS